ncbi:MAG: SUMF1/EgtB/PvdO family nonheme iron enzyme, partial [Myxococcota bacterium]|nr:SUMF1/EgtB/PvdO family nonheme iron enzyme [Myxococcota bacterium]
KAYSGRGKSCRVSLDAKGYRLPTEAEWEYIALGGARHIYAGSDSLEDVGWYWGNSYLSPKGVAQKSPNPFGIYDLSGNVSEWCLDSWSEGEYDSTVLKVEDPFYNDPEENRRVSKGGHWHMTDYGCQIRYREASSQYSPNKYQGFRLVRCA